MLQKRFTHTFFIAKTIYAHFFCRRNNLRTHFSAEKMINKMSRQVMMASIQLMPQLSNWGHLEGDGVGQNEGSKRAAVVPCFIKIRFTPLFGTWQLKMCLEWVVLSTAQ